jgi:hypothetical protein
MSERHRLPERLLETVTAELERIGAGPGGVALADILARWPEAVGETIARNAWPARRSRDGTVLVHTSSSAWAQELTHLEAQVRAKLGEDAPPLRFVVGALPARGQEAVSEAERIVHRPTQAEVAQAADLARGISAEAVREAVRKACELSLAAQRGGRTDRPI